jgi:CheY-like chemotaxis protein
MAHVLIVDDAVDVCRATAALLRMLGHRPDYVLSGPDALDYLRTAVPDLVVLDVMMPVMDGSDVLRAVRADPATAAVPVAIHSARNDPRLRDEMLALGANDYWVKGWLEADEVERRIGKLLAAPLASR